MNTDILGISELKWTGLGEFNSDGHYVYYCGKESLKNRVALTVNRPSLVAQLVKNPPAMWETWVQSLGWEDRLEKGKATSSSIPAWRISQTV